MGAVKVVAWAARLAAPAREEPRARAQAWEAVV